VKLPLRERDEETLDELRAATDNFLKLARDHGCTETKFVEGWVMPMDCGGFNGSHHSQTLKKLAAHGYADRMKLGGKRQKGSCRYRINAAGREYLAVQKRLRK
jgi:DNA-binding PadR family transcriptional regulator